MKLLCILAILFIVPNAMAHELEDNRATLVLRDKTHLSVTLFLTYSQVLHLALAPQRPYEEFLLTFSAMASEELQKQLSLAEAKFQSTIHLYGAPRVEIPLTNWIWPDCKQVQDLLRQRVMQAMVDGKGHAHESPLEVHADANAQREITTVQAQFPDEFQKMLVVAFRPNQLWVERKALSSAIKF